MAEVIPAMPRQRLRQSKRYSISRMQRRAFNLMVAPWAIGFLAFTVYVYASGFYTSLTNTGVSLHPHFVGFRNYINIFTADPLFWVAIKITLLYAVISVSAGAVCGLAVALVLNQKLKGIGLYRTVVYMPGLLPIVAIVMNWRPIIDYRFGLLNDVLALFHIHGVNWTDGPAMLWTLVILSVWCGVGGSMMVLLAGMQGVPEQLIESSSIEGANAGQRFFHITLPLITPALFFNVVMGIIGAMQMFTQAQILSDKGDTTGVFGGANIYSYTYMIHVVNSAFRETRLAYSCALSWVLFLIITIITFIIFKTSGWVYYESMNEGKGKAK